MEVIKIRSAVVVYILSILALLIFVKIDDFPLIFGFYTVAFLAYGFLVFKIPWKVLLGLAFGLRFIALFFFPGLSDDIYRFLWDGWLVTQGVNPYAALPINVSLDLNEFHRILLSEMNSPSYYSVYPTVLQAIFTSASFVLPNSLFGQMIFIKAILFAAEVGTFVFGVKVLEHIGKDKKWIFVYLLNPLVLVELMGNMHMEVLMIFGFAVFLWGSLAQKSWLKGLFGLGFSISSKLVTAVALPFMLRRIPFSQWLKQGTYFAVVMIILFAPMLWGSYENFGKGLDLYFQKFEFNASFYYVFREIGFLTKGYNVISKLGPVLAIISAVTILFLAWKEKGVSIQSLCTYMIIAFTVYYSLSTTVHPWYIALLVFLSIFTDLRYGIFWSFLGIFSYSKYYEGGELYYYLIAMEYAILWVFIVKDMRNPHKLL